MPMAEMMEWGDYFAWKADEMRKREVADAAHMGAMALAAR